MVLIGQREVDVELVLDELGIDVVEKGDNLLCRCPFHEDQHRSFAISPTSGAWICYAGCGEGGLMQLVAEARGVDNAGAWMWLEDLGVAGGSEDAVLRLLEPKEKVVQEDPLLFYETGTTYSYLVNRGFSFETLKAWAVGRDSQRRAVVIPARFNGQVVGLIYRYIYPEATIPYEYTENMPKSKMLFGWDLLPPIPEKIFVTEGPLDAMWLWQHRYPGVAVLGSRLSKSQADLLLRRTREVVLAFDDDKEGARGIARAIKALTGRVRLSVVKWPSGRKDAQECGAQELSDALENPVEAVLWSIGRV